MPHSGIRTEPNSDLILAESNYPMWETPDRRRAGWHGFSEIVRYGLTIRAPEVRILEKRVDYRIGQLESVRMLTSGPAFSALVAVADGHIVHEAYGPGFGPDRRHSMQSISKTTATLIIGKLVEEGKIDVTEPVSTYLPEIGTGYAAATVQDLLDMNVVNDYTEDYGIADASVFVQESTHGWRLPKPEYADLTLRQFLTTIKSDDVRNPTREQLYKSANTDVPLSVKGPPTEYKSANTDVLGWIAERVSGRSLRDYLIEIAEAAGIEGLMFVSTDREFTPVIDGGLAMTARDLARYGLLLLQSGHGIGSRVVGSATFIEAAKTNPGTTGGGEREDTHYSNQLVSNGHWFGHGGWGGQWLHVDQDAGVVVAFFSVLENHSAWDGDYMAGVVRMAEEIAALAGARSASPGRAASQDSDQSWFA